jgi:YD repeat-containing protein
MSRLLRFLTILTTLLLATICSAQQEVNLEQGLKPYGAYHGGDIDSVSLNNGNLVLHIPLISYPQRGNLHFAVSLFNNDENWEGYCKVQNPCLWGYKWRPGGGPQLAKDVDLKPHYNRMVILNDDGSRTTILSPWVTGPEKSEHRLGSTTGGYRTLDGSGIYVTSMGSFGADTSFSMMDSNGLRYGWDGTTTTIEDTNGNKMTGVTSGWTDSLGRSIPNFTGSTTTSCPTGTVSATSAVFPSYNGASVTMKACYKTFSFSVSYPSGSGSTTNAAMMTALLLPDGTKWSFAYDSAGSLSSITLPTGGTVSYTWATSPYASPNGNGRAVATRSVNANDGTGAHTTTYAYGGTTVHTTTVVDAAGNQAEHDFGSAGGYNQMETAARYYSGSGGSKVLLKTVITTYTTGQDDPNFDGSAQLQLFPLTVTTTLGSKTSQTTATYDNTGETWSWSDMSTDPPCCTETHPLTYGSVLQTTASDWGTGGIPGAVLRKNVSNYLWITDATTKSNNLLDLVSSAIIQDGSGTRVAETDYGYDQTSVASSGVTTQFNTTPTATKRGNQTTVSRWLTGTTFLSSTATYFNTGKTQTAMDPGGHATTFAYDVTTFKGAFPTQVTAPTTGGVTHVTSANYDFNTGVVTSSTDQNGNVTSFNYDSSFRLIQRTAPDGGQVNFAYTNASPFKVTVTAKITSSMNLTAEGEVDGLGRVKQTRLTSDPEGTDYNDTTYDVVGHVATVSNPYRTTAESTYGVTTNNYDALGRPIKTIPTDGTSSANNVVTNYTDNCGVVTDQAGKMRKTCSDGLGRLTQVFEPDSGGNFIYETDYQYDTLGNLLRIDQKGNDANSAHWRTRTFVYDALSRITQSNNPELGTINYTYDSDSNLIQKDSPAPNQTNPAVRQYITYCYDELHRDIKKYLSQQACTAANPDVTNYYDQTSYNGLTITNPKPNRTGMSDASGATAWSYDVMGRVLTQKKTIAGITKTTSSTYNFDGSVATVTYPSGRTITYAVSAAGRLLSAVDATNSINFATTTTYSAFGSLIGAKYGVTGTFTGIVTSNSYNKRLQPAILSAAAPSQTVISLSYDFGLGANNNGDVYGFTNNRDTNRSETFTYDQLNRVTSGQTTSTQWGTSYTFDIWGNLLQKTPMAGKLSGENLVQAIQDNNQLVGCGFDAAGNQTNDCLGHTIVYDAENRSP